MSNPELSFLPRLQKMFEKREALGTDGSIVPLHSMSTPNNLIKIREMLITFKPLRTLEVGLAFGASALTILATQKEISSGAFHHTAIDPFQLQNWNGCALRAIDEEGYSKHFRYLKDYSALALPKLLRDGERFDFVYVDGSHLFENVFVDFYFVNLLLNPGGIVLFDDCTMRHVRKAMKFIHTNYSDILEPIDLAVFGASNTPLHKRLANVIGIRQLEGFKKQAVSSRKWNADFVHF